MTDNGSERRKRQQVAANEMRARSRERRAERDAKIRADLQEARRSGKPAVAWWAEPIRHVVGEDQAGRPVTFYDGVVEMVNPPGIETRACAYDYRIRLEWIEGAVEAVELTAIRRPHGPRVSSRGMSLEPLGWVMDRAAAFLTRGPGEGSMTKGAARELRRGRRRARRGEDRTEELRIVARADREAAETGNPVRALTQTMLESAGFPSSESQVKVLRRQAVKAGLISPGRPGRPRRS